MADAETTAAAPPSGPPQRRDLTTGPIGKTLLLFALPTLGANILQSLNGTINAIWIGNFLGEAALAATSNANLVMFLMFSAVFGLAMAATILVGQAMGRRDVDLARRTLGSAIGLIAILGTLVAVVGAIWSPQLLRVLATPHDALPLATAYLRVIFLGMPTMFLMVLLTSALRGAGDSITPLRAMILNVVLDAGLNPVFIRGFGPIPRMGIAGSATATLIAGVVTTLFLVSYIYRKDLVIRLRGAEFGYLRPTRAIVSTIVTKGIPMGLTMVVMTASMLAMIGLVNRAGVETTAAYGAISQLWSYIQMPAFAIGAAVSAMAAQNIGAGKWDRVERMTLYGAGINVVMTTAMIGVITLVDRQVLGLFLTPSSPAVPIAQHIHLVASWSFILFGISIVMSSVVRANGAVIAPLIILIIAAFPARFGVALALLPHYGTEAIWWSFTVGSTASVLLTFAYYRWGNWRKAHLLEGARASA